MERQDLTGRTVVITGGNSGIGLEAAVTLASWGARVVITARHAAKGEAAVERIRSSSGSDRVEVRPLDLASFASVRSFAEGWLAGEDRLDVLINNAGALLSDLRRTEEGHEMSFGANHLGHFLLVHLLRDHLVASAPARVVNVASLAHRGGRLRFDDLDWEQRRYNGPQAYNDSKLCNVLFTVELSRRLAGTGVTANCCHPGPVRTGFGGPDDTRGVQRAAMVAATPFLIGPRSGSVPLVVLATDPSLADVSGRYFSRWPLSALPVGGVRPHRPSHVTAARAERLWAESERRIASA